MINELKGKLLGVWNGLHNVFWRLVWSKGRTVGPWTTGYRVGRPAPMATADERSRLHQEAEAAFRDVKAPLVFDPE